MQTTNWPDTIMFVVFIVAVFWFFAQVLKRM